MVTKIDIEGCVTDYNRVVHSVNEYIGQCGEEAIEVVRRLARTHIIHNYKGFLFPFFPGAVGTGQYGLSITNGEVTTKRSEVLTLNRLISKINRPRKITPVNPKSLPNDDQYRYLSESDPLYIFNHSEVGFSLRLQKELTGEQLENRFRERLLESLKSRPWKATEKEYWLELDQRLFESMYLCYRIPDYEEIFRLLQLNQAIWDRKARIKQILPKIRILKGYDLENENRAYTKIHEEAKLEIPLELLGLFGFEQATYHDLESLIMMR